MNYCKIRKMDISNGPGVRVSIFVQGCTFNCPNCFNKETHDFEGGKPFNKDIDAFNKKIGLTEKGDACENLYLKIKEHILLCPHKLIILLNYVNNHIFKAYPF